MRRLAALFHCCRKSLLNFIDNRQMDKLNDNGTIRAGSDLQKIRILKLSLSGAEVRPRFCRLSSCLRR
jgi:hypothetical protein